MEVNQTNLKIDFQEKNLLKDIFSNYCSHLQQKYGKLSEKEYTRDLTTNTLIFNSENFDKERDEIIKEFWYVQSLYSEVTGKNLYE